MDAIVQNIIKKQNEQLLKNIAAKLEISEEYLLKKYHIPTYYCVRVNKSLNYPINFK
jgi:hypothetical protein